MKKILEHTANIGAVTARTIAFKIRSEDGYYYPNSSWRLPFFDGYKFETTAAEAATVAMETAAPAEATARRHNVGCKHSKCCSRQQRDRDFTEHVSRLSFRSARPAPRRSIVLSKLAVSAPDSTPRPPLLR